METKNETAKIIALQSEIVARKDCFNNFGKYKYRTAEGILADVKPVANKYGFYVKLSDNMEFLGQHLVLKATAELLNEQGEVVLSSTACAVHANEKKGMDLAQLSGATSSYARKYALCGLFGIDDAEQDLDALATHGKNNNNKQAQQNNQRQQAYSVVTAEQAQILQEMIDAAGVDIQRFLAAYQCNSLGSFNAAYYDDAIAKLKTKLG